jgi:beta-galactosidase
VYVPAEWLKKGDNQITVLELIKSSENSLNAIDHPILDVLGK